MNTANKTEQEICREKNGQYGQGLEAMCKCGRTKGLHTAEKPWTFEEEDGGPECAGFKKKK